MYVNAGLITSVNGGQARNFCCRDSGIGDAYAVRRALFLTGIWVRLSTTATQAQLSPDNCWALHVVPVLCQLGSTHELHQGGSWFPEEFRGDTSTTMWRATVATSLAGGITERAYRPAAVHECVSCGLCSATKLKHTEDTEETLSHPIFPSIRPRWYPVDSQENWHIVRILISALFSVSLLLHLYIRIDRIASVLRKIEGCCENVPHRVLRRCLT
ncbi:hypothetical protein BKA93DRAFT_63230 [Sparassis latifolia]